MTEQKQGKFLVGTYLGRSFVKENTTPKGTENEWKKQYKLEFKVNDTDQFTKKITAFDSMKGFNELIEGHRYSVGYNESEPKYNEKAKKNIVYKTAFWVGEPREDAVPSTQTTIAASAAKDTIVDLTNGTYEKEFLDYAEKYVKLSATDKDLRHATRMVGGFLNNTEPFKTKLKPLFDKCNAFLGNIK